MDVFNPQWGGGVSDRVHFSHIFFTFNVQIKTCKNIVHIWGGGAGGGGVSGELD